MNPERWALVDRWIEERLLPADDALEAALAESVAAGLPAIHVAPNQGKLLHLLALGAERILEVGTLGGYSTVWLARALAPGGQLITLEADAKHADVARANLERAGLGDRVEIRVGKALESLPRIAAEGGELFDFVFVDADKPGNAAYFDWAVQLARPGARIVVDNVVRDGAVIDGASADANVQGTRRLFDKVAGDRRVIATAIQTVGAKGYDGFLLAVVQSH